MRLPDFARRALVRAASRVTARRAPDAVIGGTADPYMLRWWFVPRNRWFNVYLHHFFRSDDDRALHDHPWVNLSILVEGGYIEETIRAGGIHVRIERRAGDLKLRGPKTAHRVELIAGRPCTTIFLTGPNVRSWGFHCPRGWVHWRKFTNPGDGGATVGKGCDQ